MLIVLFCTMGLLFFSWSLAGEEPIVVCALWAPVWLIAPVMATIGFNRNRRYKKQ